LVNPRRPLFSALPTTNPQGFGLMQRDRDFGHYEDLEARYELRPSAWIEPKGKWGAGRVELVQTPAPDETTDNIVAYWVPENLPPPKEPYDFEYRMRWQKDSDARPPHAWVVQTRRGHGFRRSADRTVSEPSSYFGPPNEAVLGGGVLRAHINVTSSAWRRGIWSKAVLRLRAAIHSGGIFRVCVCREQPVLCPRARQIRIWT